MTNDSLIRRSFEEWCKSEDCPVRKYAGSGDQAYRGVTKLYWECWQAAIAAMEDTSARKDEEDTGETVPTPASGNSSSLAKLQTATNDYKPLQSEIWDNEFRKDFEFFADQRSMSLERFEDTYEEIDTTVAWAVWKEASGIAWNDGYAKGLCDREIKPVSKSKISEINNLKSRIESLKALNKSTAECWDLSVAECDRLRKAIKSSCDEYRADHYGTCPSKLMPVFRQLEVLKSVIRFADGRCWPEVQAAIDANREILKRVD